MRRYANKTVFHQSIYDAKNPYILANGYKIRVEWERDKPHKLVTDNPADKRFISPLPAHHTIAAFHFLLRYPQLIPLTCIDPKKWGIDKPSFAYAIEPILVTPKGKYKRLQIVTSYGTQRIIIASPSYLPMLQLLFMVYPAMVARLMA